MKRAIDYICDSEKTNNEIYVSTNLCTREKAHKEFELTKKQFNSKTKILAHHLIQYDGYKKNTNDKIYYMMNKKDIEMYKKSFNEIKKLCTKYPSLKNIVSKNIHDKSVFKKLNSQLDTLQTQKEKLIKDHKKLDKELKNINTMYDNYLEYIGVSRDGKESILRKIEEFKEESKDRKVGKDVSVDYEL